MDNVLVFKIYVKDLENKLWRKFEISDDCSLADLAYTALATFESYSNELFLINYKGKKYDSIHRIFDNDLYKSAMSTKLKKLNFSNSEITIDYCLESKITFVITFLEEKKTDNKHYIKIIDGEGKGILDFVSGEELKQIILDTDKLGHSEYTVITEVDGVDEEEIFDYREFDLDSNNFLAGCNFKFIKDDYERIPFSDILRIIKDRNAIFVKIDTMEIVRPYDHIKKYIPKNYKKLSCEEREKLNIPSYEDLNIYMLPSYKEINHKEIMTLYVKSCITDKEQRQELFYALRNHEYMEKFYNVLRKHNLFKQYLDYSSEYYQDIFNNWLEDKEINEINDVK